MSAATGGILTLLSSVGLSCSFLIGFDVMNMPGVTIDDGAVIATKFVKGEKQMKF